MKALVFNGSPNMDKGNNATILNAFTRARRELAPLEAFVEKTNRGFKRVLDGLRTEKT